VLLFQIFYKDRKWKILTYAAYATKSCSVHKMKRAIALITKRSEKKKSSSIAKSAGMNPRMI
jgi:hypothetical protein